MSTSTTPSKIGKFTIDCEQSKTPPRYIIYGVGSVGKTTLATSSPRPLFLCMEDGAREFKVPRVRFDDAAKRYYPLRYEEVIETLGEIAKGDIGDRETLVLDGIHALDVLIQDYVLRQNPKWKSIQTAGFGVGEAEVLNMWRPIIARLDEINTRKGVRIVLTGHQQIIKFKNPEGAEFDRYDLLVTKHPKGDVAAFLYGWAEVFAFARFEVLTQEIGKRTVAVSAQSERVLQLAWTNAYQAKCRLGGPDTVALSESGVPRSWDEVFGALEAKAPEVLREQIETLALEFDDETRGKVSKALAKVGDDTSSLAQLLENVKKKIDEKKNKEAA